MCLHTIINQTKEKLFLQSNFTFITTPFIIDSLYLVIAIRNETAFLPAGGKLKHVDWFSTRKKWTICGEVADIEFASGSFSSIIEKINFHIAEYRQQIAVLFQSPYWYPENPPAMSAINLFWNCIGFSACDGKKFVCRSCSLRMCNSVDGFMLAFPSLSYDARDSHMHGLNRSGTQLFKPLIFEALKEVGCACTKAERLCNEREASEAGQPQLGFSHFPLWSPTRCLSNSTALKY